MKWNTLALLSVAALAGCSSKEWAESALRTADATADAATKDTAAVAPRAVPSAIAGAPDRGQLMQYPRNAPKVSNKAYTLYPVSMSERHAIAAIVGGELELAAPDGTPLKVRYDHHSESPDGNWTWVGRVEGGDPGQEAIITFGENAVFGTIPQLDGSRLNLTTRAGQVYVMQINPDHYKLARPRSGHDTVAAPVSAALTASDRAFIATATKKAEAASTANASVVATTTVDLAAGYTNGYAASQGGQSAATTRLSYLVSVANQALSNSNIPGKIRLVSATQVIYPDNTDNGDALKELTGRNESGGVVSVPAALQPLLDARETYGADLVSLVRSFDYATNNGCGIAWLNGADGVDIVPTQDDDYGFSVVSDGEDDGDDNNIYFCEDHSLAHEMAHNMGSAHDIDNASGQGRYPYSYGLKAAASQGNFYTVMAYGDSGQVSYNVFSNPGITTCGGYACGVANSADNARSLTATMPIVAKFRATVVSDDTGSWAVNATDINGNAKSDLLFTNTAQQKYLYWLMDGTTVSSKSTTGSVRAGETLVAVGDFNGDGKTDMLWQTTSGGLWVWLGNGTNLSASYKQLDGISGGWSVAGAGDVDGDGKDDILFVNKTTHRYTYWLMNGSTIRTKAGTWNIGTGDTLGAYGDFNGDGKLDLAWQTTSKKLWIWLGNGVNPAASYKNVATLGAGWNTVRAGDVNGDGKDDLVFINPSPNRYTYWLMNGASVQKYGPSTAVATGDAIVAGGDFNNDKKLDLVWQTSSKDLWVWLGNGTNLSASYKKIGNTGTL